MKEHDDLTRRVTNAFSRFLDTQERDDQFGANTWCDFVTYFSLTFKDNREDIPPECEEIERAREANSTALAVGAGRYLINRLLQQTTVDWLQPVGALGRTLLARYPEMMDDDQSAAPVCGTEDGCNGCLHRFCERNEFDW